MQVTRLGGAQAQARAPSAPRRVGPAGPHARRECGGRGGAERRRLDEWLTRIEHSIKPSMAQNWRNYDKYYVKPYIGERDVLDIDGAVCDALYAKLLAEGRVKAKPRQAPAKQPVHVQRVSKNGKPQPCRPYRYDEHRCYRTHADDDPLLGKPVESAKPVGNRTAPIARRRCLRAWSPRRSSTRTGCFIARGKTSTSGAGPSVTSSRTPIRRACLGRDARSGRWHSYRPSCSDPVKTGSSRYPS